MTTRKSETVKFLDKLIGAPSTFGSTLQAIRLSDDLTQAELSKKLGITTAHLSQIERGHKFVSPERALAFAKKLGYPPKSFVSLALQDQLQRAGIKYKVVLEVA